MKKIILCLVLLLSVSAAEGAPAEKEDADFILQSTFDGLSTDAVNSFVAEMNRELDDPLPPLTLDTLQKILRQGGGWDIAQCIRFVLKKGVEEVVHQVGLMGKLLFLAVLCVLLQNLQNSFQKSGISLLAYSVCFAFLAIFAVQAFHGAVALATETIDRMVSFMEALLPLLLTLLAGAGAMTSAALLSPIMLLTVSTVAAAVKEVVLPLLLIAAALECANCLADQYRLTQLTALFRQAGMISLGLLMVIFVGVVSIHGAAGAVSDGIALRTAKFAASTFIPVVGKVFSDTVELVMGASLLLKNAVGIFGVMALGAVCVLPLFKLFSLAAVMKLTGALVEPMGDMKLAHCLTSLGGNLFLIFAALLTAALMFFLAVVMIVAAGSAAVMLR